MRIEFVCLTVLILGILLGTGKAETIENWDGDEVTFHDDGSVSIVGKDAAKIEAGNQANEDRFKRIKTYEDLEAERRHQVRLEQSRIEVLGRLEMLKASNIQVIARSSSGIITTTDGDEVV